MDSRAKDLTDEAKNAVGEAADTAENWADSAKSTARSALERARAAYETAQEKAVAGAKATDQCIRENPYTSLGIALGVGVLIGFLIRRK